jgi:hypothetical protein
MRWDDAASVIVGHPVDHERVLMPGIGLLGEAEFELPVSLIGERARRGLAARTCHVGIRVSGDEGDQAAVGASPAAPVAPSRSIPSALRMADRGTR